MSKSFEAQGIIHSIDQTREYGQNGFTKREFVIKLSGEGENPDYPNYVALELIKDKCALMDNYQVGDEVQVTFNLSGRLWNAPGKPEKCFTSLQAWKVDRVGNDAGQAPTFAQDFAPPAYDDDVPF
ncbi:hypothetical protein CHH28_17080 [Bacterioplanes sanyensis]|uniref:DUF3127 domain-containing protein n=1 Tax=Bacterioplanes sanyensis TaxID=1249553 RepID=A0A222FP47_9GAMM|nr:DUF3127 domain-containing protein [Bacterioplanes sanyensis]ASP40284.1 hypothetical protein CHH28_17080 [Bacterioplanes sanyensis]